MVEDVWALQELARLEKVIVLPDNQAATVGDLQRIRQHGDLLWTRFLPPEMKVNQPTLPFNSAQQPFKSFSGLDDEQLRNVFQRLNDYVHPNYGSHLLSLFPERSVAHEALLDAFIAIYEALFKVPWAEAETTVSQPDRRLPLLGARSWVEEERFLKDETLPNIQRHRADRGLATPCEDPAPNVLSWLESEDCSEETLFENLPDWFDPIRDLAAVLFSTDRSEQEVVRLLLDRVDLGLPPRLVELPVFAGERKCASLLEWDFPAGAPSLETSTLEWLRFTETAIGLALTTTQNKMTRLHAALVRQLNTHNPLGAILAMRSLIEHQAVALALGRRLSKGWKEVRKRSSSGDLSTEWLRKLEQDIARFLAGTKGTTEEHTSWKAQWTQASLSEALNLPAAVKEGLKSNENLVYLYNFGSNVLHGHLARGVELCPPNDAEYVKANLSRALVALDDLTSLDAALDVMTESYSVLSAMKTLREALEQSEGDPKMVIKTALLPKQKLKWGHDYTGKGTKSNPYVFAPGRPYYEAFAQLCGDLGLEKEKRRLESDPNERMLDVVQGSDREHFFLAPLITD
jgi:hypothetical protein